MLQAAMLMCPSASPLGTAFAMKHLFCLSLNSASSPYLLALLLLLLVSCAIRSPQIRIEMKKYFLQYLDT
jgi:hypothetical protein